VVINFRVMAAKRKSKKKSKNTPAKRVRTGKPTPNKAVKKKPAKKKASKRKIASKNVAASRPRRSATRPRAKKQVPFSTLSGSRRAQAQSGDADSQGLSTVERDDSESVSELLEEGNAFEAGVLTGVERADDADEREVRTRQIPEDDVPEEYLDKD
jgi:hypothetical protein